MAQGKSGKIIIEVDPVFKEQLYETLKEQGSTMKDWFLGQATALCDEHREPSLRFPGEESLSLSVNKPEKGNFE